MVKPCWFPCPQSRFFYDGDFSLSNLKIYLNFDKELSMETNDNVTQELNFNKPVELEPVNNIIDDKQRNSSAKQKLKSAENKLNGKGRTSSQLSLPDDPENVPIVLDAITAEPEVELLSMEYMELILGKKKVDKAVKEKALDFINKTIQGENPAVAEYFRNTCINVMDSMFGSGSRINLQDYLNAALFVTYRSMGDTKTRAYTKVFPDRVQRMQREGQSMAHLNSYADIYSKNQCVVDIQAKMLLPTHIVCHDLFYEAMRVTADIMNDTKVSPKVRVEAANNIMSHTKQPEIKKQELDIRINESNEIEQLKDALFNLSERQRNNIIEGDFSVVDVINQNIYVEHKDD